MFATHRDDKKRVEKALESINIQTGKVELCGNLNSSLRVASALVRPLMNHDYFSSYCY